ncbi:MAG: hypothetical protein KatS3mg124_0065 [Porticoccaceae bacterium]|nr:MAG: hypothetical protein KatS3mg124_0065 [Porticoccaceae bacterium]
MAITYLMLIVSGLLGGAIALDEARRLARGGGRR